jgi:hypothetical protein
MKARVVPAPQIRRSLPAPTLPTSPVERSAPLLRELPWSGGLDPQRPRGALLWGGGSLLLTAVGLEDDHPAPEAGGRRGSGDLCELLPILDEHRLRIGVLEDVPHSSGELSG